MTVDRLYGAVIDQLHGTGYLTPSNHIGVILETCPEQQRAWDSSLLPRIRQLGLKNPVVSKLNCTAGFGDAASAAAAIQNAVVTFKGANVDRVMFVSDNEAVILGLFGPDARSQNYKPGYMLSSNAQVQSLRSSLDSSQQVNLHGVGISPYGDVDGAKPSAADKRCQALAHSGGVTTATNADFQLLVFECGPFMLLEAALQRTDGATAHQAVQTAIDSVGSSFLAPGVLAGATRFAPGKHDGPDEAQVFAYSAGCTCMRYQGTPKRVP